MSWVSGAAGSSAVRGLVVGPLRPARVVLAVPAAIYLELEPDRAAGRQVPAQVVAVLGPCAVRVPVGIVAGSDGEPGARPFDPVHLGAPGHVGSGEVRLGRQSWRVGRWWSPDVPALGPSGPDAGRVADLVGRVPPGSGITGRGEAALAVALHRLDGAGLAAAATGLVGLGEGLTPEGDDVLAGVLVALAALDGEGQPGGARPGGAGAAASSAPGRARHVLAAAVRERQAGTTRVSAALLEQATLGRAIPELVALLRWCAPHPASRRGGASGGLEVLERLLAVGHSSGAALARGMLLGLTETGEAAP